MLEKVKIEFITVIFWFFQSPSWHYFHGMDTPWHFAEIDPEPAALEVF